MGFINDWIEGRKRRREIGRRKADLEGKLSREYRILDENAKGNNSYLIDRVSNNDGFYELVGTKTPEQIVEELHSWYTSIPHTFRSDKCFFNPYIEDANGFNGMTPRHLYRLLLMKQNLQSPEFVNHVGQLMEADVTDSYSEHGGIVVFDDAGNLRLHPLESELAKEKRPENNGKYKAPKNASRLCRVFDYHFHATTPDDTKYAGPSGGLIFFDPGDSSSCKSEVIFEGESHNLVFTTLAGDRFNVDYYGGERVPKPENLRTWVLDLGNYEYEK